MLSILLKCGLNSGLSVKILSFQLLLCELNMKEVYTVNCMLETAWVKGEVLRSGSLAQVWVC